MGRSKFPGKPSKHIFKKRVNVLPPAGENSDQEGSATGAGSGSTSASSSSSVSASASFNEDENNGKSNNEEGSSDNEDRSILNADLQSKSCVKIIENCKVKKRRKTKKSMIGDLRASGFKTKLKNIQKSRKRIPKKVDTVGRQFTRSAFESKGIVGKFVLPSRSIHSSRVIKPNKRFINVDLNENTGLKRKVLAKTICVKASKVITMKRISEKTSKFNNKSFCNSISDRISKKHVILRQARLKIHSQTTAKSIGPFSSNSNETSQSGTVTCGVCGAVRFYRFMEQACKFNIYSCESCRKFISKMIKRLACKSSASTLVCLKGFGMCHVPPIMRSQQCKLIRSAYRSRCPACWLKMCLRSFQMPSSLKTSLIELLPENMQSSFATSGSDSVGVSVTNLPSEFIPVKNKIKPPKVENRSCAIKSQSPVSNDNHLTSASVEMIKRQKVDVKGPRVKHVCRSASIVLGQTLATFPFDNNKKQTNNVKEVDVSVPLQRKKGLGSNKFKNGTDNSAYSTDKKPIGCNQPNVPCIQQKKRQKGPILSLNYDTRSKANQNPSTITGRNSISLRRPIPSFLSGRTLLSAESFPLRAVCLFCGSAGKEDLLHCLLCCEPYHPFCLKQGPVNTEEPWLCPRCTTCKACNVDDDNAKLECQKCSKVYHEKCVVVNRRRDGLFVCSQCLLCKECGSSNIKNYLLNVPLCSSCFKLKIDDKKCPLCQDIYFNSILENDSEILECGVCRKWMHLKCCKIRIEQRAILGVLPDSMGYICEACSKDNVPYWSAAVYFKLSNIFNNILQELIENKSTRNLMKLIPSSLNENSDKYLNLIKRIQPVTEGGDIESDKKKEDINSCDIDLPFGVIRSKIYSNLYKSVAEFNSEMEEILSCSGSEKLLNLYRSILLKVFPFFSNSSISPMDIISEKLLSNLTMKRSNVQYSDLTVQEDTRICVLCKLKGDGLSNKQSRLLYCRENEWVHANCVIWSSEVYETMDGRLKNVGYCISRGKTTSCTLCQENGATLNCSFKLCSKIFHFHCAETTECQFLMNNSIYCSSHLLSGSPQLCKDFTVSRPVFIEKQESKNVPQFEKIHIMIGSLQINSLGKINSVLSDNVKNIIPIGFNCTRMFWSTIEPWKITSYTITTSAINYPVGENMTSDTNFTIDHSLSLSSVNQKMKEMNNWFKEVDKSHLVDTEDDEIEEENQQGADLLSPEITDAILKEIPCDLLNGISLQDIFPKFAAGDDLNIDDVKSKIESTDKNRSCSVTLSCKLNRSISPVLKKRKLNVSSNNIFLQVLQLDGTFDDDNLDQPIRESRSIPQLDGNIDSGSDCDYQESQIKTKIPEEPVTCSRCHCTYRTRLSFRRHLESCEQITSESDSEVMEHEYIISTSSKDDHVYNSTQFVPHNNFIMDNKNNVAYPIGVNNLPVNAKTITYVPQLDNSHDRQEYATMINEPAPAAPAEYPLEVTNLPVNRYIPQLDTPHNEQDYTATMINVSAPAEHTPNTSSRSSSSSGSSSTSSSSNCTKQEYEEDDDFFIVEDSKFKPTTSSEPAAPAPGYILDEPDKRTTNSRFRTCSSSKSQYEDYLPPINIHIHPSVDQVNAAPPPAPPSYLNYSASGVILDENQMDFQGISLSNQSLQYINRNPYLNIEPHQQIIINGGKLLTNVNSYVKPAVDQYGQLMNIVTTDKSNIMMQSTESMGMGMRAHNNKPNEYTIQQETQPTIVMPNYVSLIAGASNNYQQQNDYKPIQPLTIQTEVVPAPAPAPVPQIQTMPQTVVIQQQQPQYIIDNNVPITFTQPPVYYGFETIIQNTVMASQQILPTAVPGVITANSSYQTTTQVFQTSKMESVPVPVLDIPTNTYVVVSSGQILGSVPLQLTYTQPTQLQLGTITTEAPRTLKITQSECASNNNSKPKVIKKVINLPSSPLIVKKEQNIPTNVVPPQPKIIVAKQTRPMNRVLPMKKVIHVKKIDDGDKVIKERDKQMPARAPPPVSSKENKRVINRDVKRQEVEKVKRFDDDLLKPLSDKALTKSVKKTISRDMPLLGRHDVQSYSNLVTQKIPCNEKTDPRRFSAQKQTTHIGNTTSTTTTPAVKSSAKNCSIVRFSSCLNSNRLPNPISSTSLNDPPKISTPILAPNGKRYKLDKSPTLSVQSSPSVSPLNSLASIVSNVPTSVMSKMERPKIEASSSTLIPNTNVPVLAPIKRSYPEESSVAPPYISTYSNTKSSVKTVETSLYEASSGTSSTKIGNKHRNSKNTTSCTITSASTSTGTSTSAITNTSISNYNNSPCTLLPLSTSSNSTGTIISTITNTGTSTTTSTTSNANMNGIIPAQNIIYGKKSIVKVPTMLYTIETPDGYRYSSTSVADLWSKVFEAVQNARSLHNLPPLPEVEKNPLEGLNLMGLNLDDVKYLLEQLPGAGQCTKYEPTFILPFTGHSEDDEVSIGHLYGAARFIPYANVKNDCSHDMFGWLASKHRILVSNLSKTETLPRRNSISSVPLSKRFRQLKQSTKYSVGVYRSKIHRRGLFCLKGFDAAEMVIEYSGEVIRSILCDKREKYYNSKGIGCYMFRVDDNLVVDATMKGNAARFINHSCDPNCYSKVVELQGHKHIIIFALRKINYGEELTYDYKFPFEEDKIPCTCGSKKCRKFLN